jgi:LPXTG-motif cell wall-anchored protein
MACLPYCPPMPRSRRAVMLLGLLAVLVLGAPMAALAAGGGSAGDQQYTDPLGSSTTTRTATTRTTTTGTTPATTTATPATATTPPTPTPTATVATGQTISKTASQLPNTGYGAILAGALGVGLLAAGIIIRTRPRRS